MERGGEEVEKRWGKLSEQIYELGYSPNGELTLESIVCPTKERLRLLTYLLGKSSPSLLSLLEGEEMSSTSRLMELASSVSVLGFRGSNDMNTLNGCPSGIMDIRGCEKQLDFLEDFVEFAVLSDSMGNEFGIEEELIAGDDLLTLIGENRKKIFPTKPTIKQHLLHDLLHTPTPPCDLCLHYDTIMGLDRADEYDDVGIGRELEMLREINGEVDKQVEGLLVKLEEEMKGWLVREEDRKPIRGENVPKGKETINQLIDGLKRYEIAAQEFKEIFEQRFRNWLKDSTHQDEDLRALPSQFGQLIEEAKNNHMAVIDVFDSLWGAKKEVEGIQMIGEGEKKEGGGDGGVGEVVLLDLQKKTEVLVESLGILNRVGGSD